VLRKVFLLIVAFLLAFSLCGTALAADDPLEEVPTGIISPMYTYISYTGCNMAINSLGKASVAASISAYSGVDSVEISGYLQQYDGGWITVKHWTAEASGTYVSMAKSYYVTQGYQYRWICYYYAYDGSKMESTSGAVYDSY
jgi:hypothetical protein